MTTFRTPDELLSMAEQAEKDGQHLTAYLLRDASATAGARMRLAALDQDGLHLEPWQNEKDTDK